MNHKFKKGDKCKIIFGEDDEEIVIFNQYINLSEAAITNLDGTDYVYREYRGYPDEYWTYNTSAANTCYVRIGCLIPF